MSAIEEVLEVTRANLASASNGNPTPCFDEAISAAETVEKLLELVLCNDASPERVEAEMQKLMEHWRS